MNVILLVCSGILGVFGGCIFGAFPLKTSQMSHKQERYSSALSFICPGIVILLILTGQNIASYLFIVAIIIGFGIAKISPVHRWLTSTFKLFKAKKQK